MGFYDDGYLRWRASPAHAALFGEGLPASVQPFSFVPLAGMELVLAGLALQPGQTLVDFGCGRGGPGLWLASQSRARLIGVDSSKVAVGDARERVELFPGVPSAEFTVADVTHTGLSSDCCDAVVSIDVLQLVDDQKAMVGEAARLLKSGGRIVVTSWEAWEPGPARFPRDLRGLFTGFQAVSVTEHPAWLERQFGIYDRAEESRKSREWRPHMRRVAVTAVKE